MISNNPTTPKDLKGLTKQRDFFKGLLIGACILWLFILAAAIYFYSKKDNIALFIPVFSLIVVFLPIFLRFKSLDAEIKSKKLG
ncbi:hypothetical protein [Pedobacter metabolipauper]|uniref:Uncharacterized protein n=1 Tax=Pedobacter metabolipauper TaxID=425513 RepID=A0A4R6STJ1_9SPHI|nr:hypothetical protein [Pedobacter metabolipauper]TDQ08328.1 hypothetical protein ATK78_2837 [Pedobacter metabolipauper]